MMGVAPAANSISACRIERKVSEPSNPRPDKKAPITGITDSSRASQPTRSCRYCSRKMLTIMQMQNDVENAKIKTLMTISENCCIFSYTHNCKEGSRLKTCGVYSQSVLQRQEFKPTNHILTSSDPNDCIIQTTIPKTSSVNMVYHYIKLYVLWSHRSKVTIHIRRELVLFSPLYNIMDVLKHTKYNDHICDDSTDCKEHLQALEQHVQTSSLVRPGLSKNPHPPNFS